MLYPDENENPTPPTTSSSKTASAGASISLIVPATSFLYFNLSSKGYK